MQACDRRTTIGDGLLHCATIFPNKPMAQLTSFQCPTAQQQFLSVLQYIPIARATVIDSHSTPAPVVVAQPVALARGCGAPYIHTDSERAAGLQESRDRCLFSLRLANSVACRSIGDSFIMRSPCSHSLKLIPLDGRYLQPGPMTHGWGVHGGRRWGGGEALG